MNNTWDYIPHNGKTCIYVVRVNNYWPELCELTLPNLRYYAKKIGAEFFEITERKYPDFPATYEKLQVYELGQQNEWNILIDADFLLHPLMPDLRLSLNYDVVGIDCGYDASNILDTRSKYFLRDGRNRGIATGIVVTNNVNHDLWEPLEMSWEEARTKTKREHIIDEYCLSRNLARFGLKYTGLFQDYPEMRSRMVHLGAEGKTEKERTEVINKAETLLRSWGQL